MGVAIGRGPVPSIDRISQRRSVSIEMLVPCPAFFSHSPYGSITSTHRQPRWPQQLPHISPSLFPSSSFLVIVTEQPSLTAGQLGRLRPRRANEKDWMKRTGVVGTLSDWWRTGEKSQHQPAYPCARFGMASFEFCDMDLRRFFCATASTVSWVKAFSTLISSLADVWTSAVHVTGY